MLEKKLRALLLKWLGTESYLGLVSSAYIRLIQAGFLKGKYPELYYLSTLVKPGFVCIDIGANVGYYSVFLSKYAGRDGKVYAVEPVPLFANIFKRNTKKFALDNITLYPYALGDSVKTVTLGTPVLDGVFRHGLTRILDQEETGSSLTYEAHMQIPDDLFSSLPKIDFIKCDVEGYEVHLFPHMIKTLSKFKPLIQIEITAINNRKEILHLLKPIGYQPYGLKNDQLELLDDENALRYEGGDFYFKSI
ncbi:MAG: FkbM family methyltransferase [Bacteroidota bacterium]|nr:FkbM family methyltransferase [Bacteroidota bacterium]